MLRLNALVFATLSLFAAAGCSAPSDTVDTGRDDADLTDRSSTASTTTGGNHDAATTSATTGGLGGGGAGGNQAASTSASTTGGGGNAMPPADPCGDGVCQAGESPDLCPEDCSTCGNTICDKNLGETTLSCPIDCKPCGDGTCNQAQGESSQNCPQDCGVGDTCNYNGVCNAPTENQFNCPQDCGHQNNGPKQNDGVCQVNLGENAANSLNDCINVCGDDVCVLGYEGWYYCPNDCAGVHQCGDYVCSGNETGYNCPNDCAVAASSLYCGDGLCSQSIGEYGANCATDCGWCGDGYCSASIGEDTYTCSTDCGSPQAYCGDGSCNGYETYDSCYTDCYYLGGSDEGYCGDGYCDYDAGEDYTTCSVDCA